MEYDPELGATLRPSEVEDPARFVADAQRMLLALSEPLVMLEVTVHDDVPGLRELLERVPARSYFVRAPRRYPHVDVAAARAAQDLMVRVSDDHVARTVGDITGNFRGTGDINVTFTDRDGDDYPDELHTRAEDQAALNGLVRWFVRRSPARNFRLSCATGRFDPKPLVRELMLVGPHRYAFVCLRGLFINFEESDLGETFADRTALVFKGLRAQTDRAAPEIFDEVARFLFL